MEPKVSIAIPHYNHGKFIERAVRSIQDQDFSNYEIVIVDDASTDDSYTVLQKLAAEDKRIKLFQNKKNFGTEITLNNCINFSKGELLICRAADDLCAPGFLKNAVELMDKHLNAGLCVGDVEFIDENNQPSGVEALSLSTESKYFTSEEIIRNWKSDYNLPSASAIYRKSDFVKAGFYLKGLRWHADWMLNMIIAFRSGLIYCPKVFVKFRLDSGSYGNSRLLDNEAQDSVFHHLLNYLKNDFQDVLPAFMRSGALDLFAPRIVDTYYKHTDLWSIELLNALQKPIYTWNKRKETYKDDHGISKNIRSIIDKNETQLELLFQENNSINIAVYGAGLHTEKLLRVWSDYDFPEISIVVVSDQPESSYFNSIPVTNINSLKSSAPDLILLSSQSFEDAMANTIKELFPEKLVLSFWKRKYTKL